MNDFIKYAFWFVLLIILQELVFDNIQFTNFLTPYVYILLIIALPFYINSSIVILVAFALGLSVDLISGGVPGAHAAACTAIGYLRKYLIRAILSKSEYDSSLTRAARSLEYRKYALYAFILVLVHHTILFLIESASLFNLHFVAIRIFISAVISTVFVLLLQKLMGQNQTQD